METWLEVDLQTRFSGRVLPIGAAVANRWGLLAAQAKTKAVSLPVIDGLPAAAAIHYDLTLVSRNARDFARVEVPVVNPWTG
jgi:predicted nucleic acid-binding protein